MLHQLLPHPFNRSPRRVALCKRRPLITRYILKLSIEIRELNKIASTIQSDPHQREEWILVQRKISRLENRRRLANHQYSRLQTELHKTN